MNNVFSKAAVWLVIALVLFTVFKQFDSRQSRGSDMPYSQFMTEAKEGRIESVTIDGRTLRGRTKDNKTVTVFSPSDPWMVGDLMKFGVQVNAKPEEEQSLLLNIFVSWFPMLLLIGVWVFFMRQMQGGGRGGAFSFGKSKARLQNYEKMQSETTKEKEAKLEIFIPNGQRLGDKVIEFKNVSKAYGDKLLFENLTFSLPPAGIVGIIGPNGAGKTTLFRMIMGEEKPDSGTITIGETVQTSYVDQSHEDLLPEKTVWEVISGGLDMMLVGGMAVPSRAYSARFNFSGNDQNKKVAVLSGGERNRLHLAITLKKGSNVLLLDEPTNDLDVNTLRALEEGIEDYSGCAVIISHDRWFLDRICTHILAFEGDSNVYWFEGNFQDYEENRKKRLGGDIVPHRMKYRKLVRG